jgi:threonine synthase
MERNHGLDLRKLLTSFAIDDSQTRAAVSALDETGYLADPHSALAWRALSDRLEGHETGVFLCTAHPAKFKETIEDTLGREVELPAALEQVAKRRVLSEVIPADFNALRDVLMGA